MAPLPYNLKKAEAELNELLCPSERGCFLSIPLQKEDKDYLILCSYI